MKFYQIDCILLRPLKSSICAVLLVLIAFLMLNQCGVYSEESSAMNTMIPDQSVRLEEAMHREIDWVDFVIKRNYPLQIWKKVHLKLLWSEKVKEAHRSIKSDTTQKEYVHIIKRLLFSLKDPHIYVDFNFLRNTKSSAIPITFLQVKIAYSLRKFTQQKFQIFKFKTKS